MGALIGQKDQFTCTRGDGRNLVKEWLTSKSNEGKSAQYVTTAQELDDIDVSSTDYLMGLFDESHLPFELDRDHTTTAPSLANMTLKAISMLKKSTNGFFLLVSFFKI